MSEKYPETPAKNNLVPAKDKSPRAGPGRPKGSKNKLTLLRLAGEGAIRENNMEKMVEVCEKIIDQALTGDISSQRLVWQSMVSNTIPNAEAQKEKVSITINAAQPPREEKVVTPTIIEAKVEDK